MKAIRQTRPRPSPRLLQSLEQARDCCRNLATLAAFLECCGSGHRPERRDPELLSHAGVMIARDVQRVREILARLQTALVNDQRKK